MYRIRSARLALLGVILLSTGCSWWDDRPGLMSRFRASCCGGSTSQVIPSYSGGNCGCETTGPLVGGPMLQGPEQLQGPGPIPRIDENGGKQMPWDPDKMKSSVKPGTEVKTIRTQ